MRGQLVSMVFVFGIVVISGCGESPDKESPDKESPQPDAGNDAGTEGEKTVTIDISPEHIRSDEPFYTHISGLEPDTPVSLRLKGEGASGAWTSEVEIIATLAGMSLS